MADEAEDIELQIDDANLPADDDIVVEQKPEDKASPAPEPKDQVDEGLERLKAQLETERQARLNAERQANEFAQREHQAKTAEQDANLNLIVNAIETVKQGNTVLKASYRDALAAQDYDLAADIQMEMSSNAAKLQRLEEGKQALEAAPKAEAPRPIASDPVEALASQLTPRSAAWVRAHPEYASDPRKYQQMLAAHNLAVTSGVEPDSDAYFESVETSLRIRREPVQRTDDTVSSAAAPVERRASPAAAPVSRSAPNSPTTPRTVRLTAEEREMAGMMGLTVEEYARNKLALQREGKLN